MNHLAPTPLPVDYTTLTAEEKRYVRERYTRKQEGRCHHCNALLTELPDHGVPSHKINRSLFPANFFDWPVHLHHDHFTNMTIGAVHAECNAVLWQFYGE